MSELRGLGVIHEELAKRGGGVIAISVDTPEESKRVVERNKLPFPILSDPDLAVIDAYGLRHAGGGPDGGDIAIPAHFLIGAEGRIRWKRVASRIQDRSDPETEWEEIRTSLEKR